MGEDKKIKVNLLMHETNVVKPRRNPRGKRVYNFNFNFNLTHIASFLHFLRKFFLGALESECQLSKTYILHMKISQNVFTNLVKFEISLVLLQITN